MFENFGIDTISVAGVALALAVAMGLAIIVMALIGPKPKGEASEPDPRFVGESVGGDEDDCVVPGSIRIRPPRRKITGWVGDGRVVAVDAHGQEFVGRIIRRAPSWRRQKGGWAFVQRMNSRWAVWCRLPAPI